MAQTVLVLGDYRQTITVVRSLARAGFEVSLGARRDGATARSRHVSDAWIYDSASAERFCDSVEAYLRSEKPDFVFVVGESELRRLIQAGQHLRSLSTWIHPDFATIARCFDKAALYELAAQVGVPTLPWRCFTGAQDWREGAREMGFPVVIKRNDSSGRVHGRKALICRTPAELEGFLATVPPETDAGQLVLQKYLAGVRHNCHVACDDGRIVAYFQQTVLRTDELDDTGYGTAGMSVAPSPELRAHCERLTRALGYSGIGCIQFMVDEATGAVGFLELNARMDSTALLPYRLGLDYPRIALELARGRASNEPRRVLPAKPYALGKTYHWLRGDLLAWVTAARRRGAGAAALALWALHMAWLCLRSHHLTFDWRDPLPTLHMYWEEFGRPLLRKAQIGARGTWVAVSARVRPLP